MLSKDKLQLRKKIQMILKSNNKWQEQLQQLKASEEELLAKRVSGILTLQDLIFLTLYTKQITL